MTMFILDEDRLVAHRLDRFETIAHLTRDEMTGTVRAPDGSTQTVVLDASATRIEVLGCPVIPTVPGHFALRPVSDAPDERQLHRIAIVGWHVTSVCAYPVTVDQGCTSNELYADAIEFPDGHVEFCSQRFDSAEEFCHSSGYALPLPAVTYIPEGGLLN
jgi:hypothetical protein